MVKFTVLLLSCCTTAQVLAQSVPYPTKPIRMIVPTPSRTSLDLAARILGRSLTESWAQSVIADNRAAGNGVAAQEMVASAQPDGHTLLVQSIGFVTLPLYHKLPFDTERDFTPVARIASSSLALVAHPSLPATSVAQLIAAARQKPGAVGFASYGNGSAPHLALEALGNTAGVKLAHVPRRDAPEALDEVMSGRVQAMFLEVSYAAPHVEGGTLRALATTGRARSSLVPGVPTLAESGIKDYEFALWLGAFAPAGTPSPIVQTIAAELARVLEIPATANRLATQGYEPAWLSAAEFQRYLKSESQKFTALVRKTGASRQ